jgi:hypothetical protein
LEPSISIPQLEKLVFNIQVYLGSYFDMMKALLDLLAVKEEAYALGITSTKVAHRIQTVPRASYPTTASIIFIDRVNFFVFSSIFSVSRFGGTVISWRESYGQNIWRFG